MRAQASGLAPAYQSALDSALGLGGSEPPEHFRIALAALDLLSNAATDRPLLLVAEDVHWLDQPSVDVLSFVARRLEAEPIVLLATARDGYPKVFNAGELPELRVQPLDPGSAARLLVHTGALVPAPERARTSGSPQVTAADSKHPPLPD